MRAQPSRSTSHPPDVLGALRGATRAHHDRVDRLVDLQRLQDPTHYACVLQVLDAFLAGWEPAVSAALPSPWQEWLRVRSRRPFLQSDLHQLGLRARAPARIAAFADAPAAWGSIYVMEGSALGGQFISRALARTGITPARGGAYFHGWGEATGGMWREVRTLLATQLESPEALERACDAARATFDALSHLLEESLNERAAAA